MTALTIEKALVEPEGASGCEQRLARLWEKNLGVRVVQPGDDYFQLGGESLLATQLISWIRDAFGVELSLLDLFEAPTVAAQARLLLQRSAADAAPVRVPTEYLYFSSGIARLFGALHRAAGKAKATAVLLCYPIGQEYMRVHRTYVELARSLSAAGFHVLRFDYFGCGDSEGETSAGTMRQWRKDIEAASRELRERTGAGSVCLLGSRVGANMVFGEELKVDNAAGMVLWEPILNGEDYLAALRQAHHDLLHNNAVLDGYSERGLADCHVELVGFPFSKDLYDEVVAIDLRAVRGPGAANVMVLANAHKPALEQFAQAFSPRAEYLAANDLDGIWLKTDDENKGVIPVNAVQSVVSWVSRRMQ